MTDESSKLKKRNDWKLFTYILILSHNRNTTFIFTFYRSVRALRGLVNFLKHWKWNFGFTERAADQPILTL